MGVLNMKRLTLFAILLTPTLVIAEPASQVAWTPEMLEFVKQGNAAKGKELAATCTGCHGEKGVSPMPGYPSLAGQLATYTYKQLRDYADNSRPHTLMSSIATGLSEQDSADLAVWFNTLALPPQKKADPQSIKRAKKLATRGEGKRILPPCSACHGTEGQGEKMDIPALAGQQAEYFEATLKEYKTGDRHNDIYSRMRLIAKQLTEEEIKDLAQYYLQLK
jgi:cytochrome c553